MEKDIYCLIGSKFRYYRKKKKYTQDVDQHIIICHFPSVGNPVHEHPLRQMHHHVLE